MKLNCSRPNGVRRQMFASGLSSSSGYSAACTASAMVVPSRSEPDAAYVDCREFQWKTSGLKNKKPCTVQCVCRGGDSYLCALWHHLAGPRTVGINGATDQGKTAMWWFKRKSQRTPGKAYLILYFFNLVKRKNTLLSLCKTIVFYSSLGRSHTYGMWGGWCQLFCLSWSRCYWALMLRSRAGETRWKGTWFLSQGIRKAGVLSVGGDPRGCGRRAGSLGYGRRGEVCIVPEAVWVCVHEEGKETGYQPFVGVLLTCTLWGSHPGMRIC